MKGHVLIVDDNINNLRIAVDILIHEDLRLTTAKSGSEAITALKRNQIDLILLDINMPEMDGFETIKEIRKIDDCQEIPVLFVTSHTDENFLEEGFAAGCVDFILKPFRPIEFIARIKNHLSLSLHKHQLKQLVDEKTSLLQETIKELQASKAAKDEFLGVMSHELRTPLNGILGMTELLKIPELKERQNEIINDLESSAKRLNKLISDILNFNSLEEPKAPSYSSAVNLDDYATHIKYLASCRDISKCTLEVTTSPDLPKVLLFDKKGSLKIVECIIDNAFKFTPKGTIHIHLSVETINSDEAILSVSIKDNGPGISQEHLSKIFDKFYQVDSGMCRSYEGAGIGLAIVSKLAKAMESEIKVTSELGVGSNFTLLQATKIKKKKTYYTKF